MRFYEVTCADGYAEAYYVKDMVDLHGQVNGLQVTDWDGSDIFSFSNWIGVMICSEKLKEACEKEKIKGIRFIPIEKLHL